MGTGIELMNEPRVSDDRFTMEYSKSFHAIATAVVQAAAQGGMPRIVVRGTELSSNPTAFLAYHLFRCFLGESPITFCRPIATHRVFLETIIPARYDPLNSQSMLSPDPLVIDTHHYFAFPLYQNPEYASERDPSQYLRVFKC